MNEEQNDNLSKPKERGTAGMVEIIDLCIISMTKFALPAKICKDLIIMHHNLLNEGAMTYTFIGWLFYSK